MKNRILKCIMVVTSLAIVMSTTGCNTYSFRHDKNHATVTVTTSSGNTYVSSTYNSSDRFFLTACDTAKFNSGFYHLNEGETATITFMCEDCGNKQVVEVSEDCQILLVCDCPKKYENGKLKEYAVVEFDFVR